MRVFALLMLIFCSRLTLAATPQELPVDSPQSQAEDVKEYTYGMPLEIAHVISTTDISKACGVVPVRMIYEDYAGRVHTISYRVLGNGCAHH